MYLVIGANGYIGSYVIKNILEKTSEIIFALGAHMNNVVISSRIHGMKCDITNPVDINQLEMLTARSKDVKVIYLAAMHRPDMVKNKPQEAWNVNITALANVLNHLRNVKCLYYVSTEMVYGAGSLDFRFKESDALKPVNLYGVHKKIAEQIVLGGGHHVVRFPFVIGKSLLPDRKHFYDEIIETLKSGKPIEMFTDAYKSALDFQTAASLLVDVVEADEDHIPKILNVAGDDILSKYEIGLHIAEAQGLDSSLIIPAYMNQSNIYDEKRAACTLLDNTLLKQTLNLKSIKMKFS